MKAIVNVNVSQSDSKRIAAAALSDEAKYLRKSVKRARLNDPAATAARGIAEYLEARAEVLLLEAETLDHL